MNEDFIIFQSIPINFHLLTVYHLVIFQLTPNNYYSIIKFII